MKEMERIVLLRILRKQKEEADRLIDTFSEESKNLFIEAAKKADNPKSRAHILDSIIAFDYDCKHEYGLCNPNDSFGNKDCMCLDCGEYLDMKDIQKIYYVNDNMEDIREEYLELLQSTSVCDSFTKLKRKYHFTRD